MRNRTTNKAVVAFTSIICFIIFVALAFIVTSLVMASVNDRSLVDEWKSWGVLTQEEVVDDETENEESIDITVDEEPEAVGIQNVNTNYSNVIIEI